MHVECVCVCVCGCMLGCVCFCVLSSVITCLNVFVLCFRPMRSWTDSDKSKKPMGAELLIFKTDPKCAKEGKAKNKPGNF